MNLKGRPNVARKKIRKGLPKEVADAVLELVDEGWSVVEGGHKYILVCPCPPEDFVSMPVGGTIRNPTWAARSILREARRACPDRHELLRR